MNAIDSILWRIVREIEPTSAQKESAKRSHNYLRGLLSTGQLANRWTRSYLSGSYVRNTAIRPIDDVDVIFEIDPNAWGHFVGLLGGPPPSNKILDSFAQAIRYRYPVSSVYGQRRSVRLELFHLDIDVVPAIPLDSDPGIISVPDRDTGEWIRSSPIRHSENATRVNKKHNSRFKPLVKLLKCWNGNLPSTVRFKSFTIETIAIRLFDSLAINTLEEGALLFWDFIAARFESSAYYRWTSNYGMSFGLFGVNVPDAAGTGSNTAGRLTSDHARSFSTKARISRDRLLAARTARTTSTRENHIYDAFRT